MEPTEQVYISLESSALHAGSTQVFEVRGSEAIGRFFEFEVSFLRTSDEDVDVSALVSNPAALVFHRDGAEERRIFGAIRSVRDALLSESNRLSYTVELVPRAWPMAHHRRSEIFLDVSIPDILRKKIERAGLDPEKDCSMRLLGAYAPRELVMQYEETDLAFCSRLCEHWGIALFFEHDDGRDVLVFSDENSGYQPISGDPRVAFHRRGERLGVYGVEVHTKVVPARYVLKDYNYRTPSVALVAEAEVDAAGRGDVLEYGAHFKTPGEGNRIVQCRAEELRATKRVLVGVSEVPRLAAGARFTLEDHPKLGAGELLVTEVRHEAVQAAGFGAAPDARPAYRNEFRAIDAATPFRPPRVTPKPRVHGAISGVVEAAAEGDYAELDEQGRYHVRFMLDQGDAPKAGASSVLRMAQPHAGPGYGFHFPLRDGVEVVLTCIEGDPDRPLITGAVPNPTTPTTVSSGNAPRNVIRTGGGTELNIDDTDAGTSFQVAVPFANTVLSLGAAATAAGFYVGTDQQATFETGQSITLTAGTEIGVTANGGAITLAATAGDVTIGGSTGVHVQGNPIFQVSATALEMQGTATAHLLAPVTSVVGSSFLALSAGAMTTVTSPVTAIKGTGFSVDSTVTTITGSVGVDVNGAAIAINGGPSVTVKGGIVAVTGGIINLNC